MFDPKIMSDRIRSARFRKAASLGEKLTQEDVAVAADVSRSHVANAERGGTGISIEVAAKLADYYEVTLDYLSGRAPASTDMAAEVAQTPEEIKWLGVWRDMDQAQKRRAVAILRAMIDTDAA